MGSGEGALTLWYLASVFKTFSKCKQRGISEKEKNLNNASSLINENEPNTEN